jgi:hypothetical protein
MDLEKKKKCVFNLFEWQRSAKGKHMNREKANSSCALVLKKKKYI